MGLVTLSPTMVTLSPTLDNSSVAGLSLFVATLEHIRGLRCSVHPGDRARKMTQVICLQPVAIVDHVAHVTDEELMCIVGDEEQHGSRRVDASTAQRMLQQISAPLNTITAYFVSSAARGHVKPCHVKAPASAPAAPHLSPPPMPPFTVPAHMQGEFTQVEVRPGGSSANCCRAMAAGFGVDAKIFGVRGNDDAGATFHQNMKSANIDTSQLYSRDCPTGCSIILSCSGERTMRTCMEGCERLQAADVSSACLQAEFVMLSGYCLYGPDFTKEVIEMAHKAAAKVIFDLASFEIVRRFSTEIWDIINSGHVYAVFGNADEWKVLGDGIQGSGDRPSTHETDGALSLDLSALHETQRRVVQNCQLAVTTRGSQGCVAMEHGGEQHSCPAMVLDHVKDPTGAGDLFASGFVHGLLVGVSIQDCCRIGCACGAAATQVDGAEMTAALGSWVYGCLDGLPIKPQSSSSVDPAK